MEPVYGASVEDLGTTLELYQKRGGPMQPAVAMASILASAGMGDKVTADKMAKRVIDVSWLPFASESYQVSPKISDYVVTGVPIITSDIPNRNMQAMPADEILSFKPRVGRVTYRTFIGKPTFQNHKNDDPVQAKGINLDAVIARVPKYNLYKIVILSAFDRSKDTTLASDIMKRIRRFYSMGAWVEWFECSVCGSSLANHECPCFLKYKRGGVTRDRKLVFQQCRGVDYFENSSVDDPADITAIGDEVLSFT